MEKMLLGFLVVIQLEGQSRLTPACPAPVPPGLLCAATSRGQGGQGFWLPSAVGLRGGGGFGQGLGSQALSPALGLDSYPALSHCPRGPAWL